MEQPALGKKISELRKSKGLTQEELVEKCNISVRTIQRIENGEVTPRSYTVKAILAALEQDMSTFVENFTKNAKDTIGISSPLQERNTLLHTPISDHQTKQLHIAWFAGIVYFICSFFEVAAEYMTFDGSQSLLGTTFYILIKIILLISLLLFIRGFIVIGELFNHQWLKTISYIYAGCTICLIGYEMLTVYHPSELDKVTYVAAAIIFGGIKIFFGASLLKLQNDISSIAKYAGILEIIAGVLLMTVILFFIADIILMFAEIIEILLIYLVIKKKEKSDINL
ncbi:helix-turn-helix transcriptional regulator [Aquimarina sp. TRL1]|uniref:helix-turn-helix domain-containing protein n=1 Tax=Aquimarina sp. (strain TRL1) TaxID=2736252 RepID=UPI001589DD30|nr:helix-turn-helix transcriptional regulator [Aquimarina sp. TRL1]QKX06078.1 helix-turn-helix transcriptional regulator [Aquimarina sp. TRL1]